MMDPNALLAEMRRAITEWRTLEHRYAVACEGGFLPDAWQGGADYDYTSSAGSQHYIDTGERARFPDREDDPRLLSTDYFDAPGCEHDDTDVEHVTVCRDCGEYLDQS